MYIFCICAAMIAAQSTPVAEDQDPFQPENLVHAKCIRVEYRKNERSQTATFRIDHVYCGDAKLKETTFQESTKLEYSAIKGVFGHVLDPLLREGEEGIWYLQPIPEVGLDVAVVNSGSHRDSGLTSSGLALPVPARKIVGDQEINAFYTGKHIHYPSALRWARVVEKVYKMNRADRLKSLREYLRSDNPYVAAWALRTLANYKPKDLIPLLDKLSGDSTVSVAAQVTVDDLMCRVNWKKWNGSKQRAALLHRWVSGDIIETHDVLMIAARIENAFRMCPPDDDVLTPQMDWKTWLPLMDKWVSANYLSPPLESHLYGMYQRVRHPAYHSENFIFSYSIDILKTSKDRGRQRFAAKWLERLHPQLTAKQRAIVKDLRETKPNPRIQRLLDEAMGDASPEP